MNQEEARKLFDQGDTPTWDVGYFMRHAMAWRLVCEIMRRFPGRFQVNESHPGGGQHDSLQIVDLKTQTEVIHLNTTGSLHVFKRWNGHEYVPHHDSYPLWKKMADCDDPKKVVDAICALVGWKVPAKLPPPNPYIVTCKFIAAFMAHALFTRATLRCSQGGIGSNYLDTNCSPHFEFFPAADQRRAAQTPPEADYADRWRVADRFWFLCDHHKPIMCFEMNGQGLAWTLGGPERNLWLLYKKHKTIWPVIYEVAQKLL